MSIVENQVHNLVTIMKSKELQEYSKKTIFDLMVAVVMKDNVAAIEAADDMKNLIFHTPTILFWDKMKRYLCGTFYDYEDQVKLAEKFYDDNEKYEEFVKRQMHLINEIDDDRKVDYFAALTRSFLLTSLERELFFKLAKYINLCTSEELNFLQSIPFNYGSQNNPIISSLYQYGLFTPEENKNGKIEYKLSDFAIALKQNSLNFDEGLSSGVRLSNYSQLTPINIAEPATWEEFEDIFNKNDITLSAGTSSDVI